MNGDLDLVSRAALEAGRLALELRDKGLTVQRKPGGSPVTNGDLAVDAMLTLRLRTARPEYGWLSEETPDDPARLDAGRLFIVDPIDGTSAYIKDRPWFVVSIAVVEAGRPIAAAIYAPATRELYTALDVILVRRNGFSILGSASAALETCRMLGEAALFAHPDWREPWPAMQLERRNAIAYRMALVGAGDFDAAVSLGQKFDWDMAAGDLIAREAGAQVSDAHGRRLVFNTAPGTNDGLICATPALHRLILSRTAPIDQPIEAEA